MNPEDIERRLNEAFTVRAHRAVDDQSAPPPLRLDQSARTLVAPPRRHRLGRVIAPLATAAAIVAVAAGIAIHRNSHPSHAAAARTSSQASTTSPPSGTGLPLAASQIGIKLAMAEGAHVGVGMPVVAYFSQPVTDARDLQRVTSVTVDGKPVVADWYFTKSTTPGYPVQGHLRMSSYWPAHATVDVAVPAAGWQAGNGRTFATDFSVKFSTGAAVIATVLDAKHTMTVMEDGKFFGSYRVSLGAATTPTTWGTKVVMAKGSPVCMTGADYHLCDLQFTQKLTDSGEYLMAAPWNTKNIDQGIDSSNGCTNLTKNDAATLYSMMEVGDVVLYPKTDGPAMPVTDGLGDWNVPWKLWQLGGLAPTH